MMIVAMGLFAAVDTFVKLSSTTLDAGQIIALTSAGSFVTFWAIMLYQGDRFFRRDALNPALLTRSACDTMGAFGIVMALSLAPLSTVVAIGQAQPLVVTAGAAFILGETVGWRRWTAVCIGLVGVLVILRPGFGEFNPNLLWTLLYIVALAGRDLASRKLPGRISNSFAVGWSMLPMTLAGILVVPFQGGWQPVTPVTWIWLAGIVVAVSAALWCLTAAMRLGEVSAVAPYRYVRIVYTLIIAYLIFGEVPDALTWIGVGLIIGAGVYAFVREHQLARRA